MSNPFKLRFNLQQHTPIVHFQHSQKGATLRATELKPKLDRFLIKYVFKEDFDVFKKFLIGYSSSEEEKKGHKEYKKKYDGKWAFDYEVKIEADNGETNNIDDRFPLFFGNLENEQTRGEKKYKFKFNKNSITLTVFSFHTELLDQIKGIFLEFIFKVNFGTRQSKGFGSFTASFDNEWYIPRGIPFFTISDNNYEVVFKRIQLFYKSIRGGINGFQNLKTGRFDRSFYMKPFIFAYAKKHNIQWDKKTVKSEFFHEALNNEIIKYNLENENREESSSPLAFESEEKYDVKDLLGLSTTEQWKLPNQRGDYKIPTMVNKAPTTNEIERFQSPILFKPVKKENKGYNVYVLLNPIPAEYLNASIEFRNNGNDFSLPLWKEFNIHDFFEFVLNHNIELLIPDSNNKNSDFAQELKRIIRELKSSNNQNEA